VTGGAGFVGTNLCKKLVAQGHKVSSLDNYSTGTADNHIEGVDYRIGDVRSYKAIPDVDMVFHLAAIARIQPSFKDPVNYITTNANGTLEIIQHCVKNKIPMVYAGSSSKHSGRFKNPYTFSKDLGEDLVTLYRKHFGLKSCIARFYNVYGPHQLKGGGYSTLIGRWINNLEKKLPCAIYGDGEKRRDFTHVDDIVNALILMMEREAYGHEFELGRGKNHSINEVAKMFKIEPVYEEDKPGEAQNTLCESKLAREVLGWEPKINLSDWINENL
jgi:UDP-glucose 4-epimerase